MKSKLFVTLAVFLTSLSSYTSVSAESPCEKKMVVKAVEQAVLILESEGTAGLDKVKEIRFCEDNYVFVNDLRGKTLMHIKPQLIGKVLIGLKDDTGKRFFADFAEVAKNSQTTQNGQSYFNGKGWVSYRWPKPGEKDFSPKESYIQGCRMDQENVYVGAGIYTK